MRLILRAAKRRVVPLVNVEGGDRAATTIQSQIRRRAAKKRVVTLKRKVTVDDQAATKIQSRARGRITRKK